MLAVEYHANDDVRVVELPIPEIGVGEILVQLRACGLCASDVMEWYMKPRAPIYPGHEPVGVIAAVGEGDFGAAEIEGVIGCGVVYAMGSHLIVGEAIREGDWRRSETDLMR